MSEIEFAITQHLGVLGEASKGWKKELNMVSWNKREPKFDLRDWDPGHEKMGKGITLTREEALALRRILNETLVD